MHILVHGQQLLKLTKGVRSVRTQLTMIFLERVRCRFITSLFTQSRSQLSQTRPQKGVSNERIQHHTQKVIKPSRQSIPDRGALCHYND